MKINSLLLRPDALLPADCPKKDNSIFQTRFLKRIGFVLLFNIKLKSDKEEEFIGSFVMNR